MVSGPRSDCRLVRPRARGALVAFALLALAAGPADAQQADADTPPAAEPSDVESIDAIIHALYDVISGPPGERDWDRFRSLFRPDIATLIPTAPPASDDADRPLPVLSPEDYVEQVGPFFRENGFFEREVARDTERFGNVAQAFSTYESRRNADDEAPFARGINSIQLVRYDGRWWIVAVAWDEDRAGNPIPEEYGG